MEAASGFRDVSSTLLHRWICPGLTARAFFCPFRVGRRNGLTVVG